MTWAAGTFGKRFMADWIQHAFYRAAMGAVTGYAGIGFRANLPVRFRKGVRLGLMAFLTQNPAGLRNHPLQISCMRTVTVETILYGWLMSETFEPVFRDFKMTIQTQHRLIFFENIFVLGAVCYMTAGTLTVNGGLMLNLFIHKHTFCFLMTAKTQLVLLLLDNIIIVSCMGQVTGLAISLFHRVMLHKILTGFLNIPMAGQAEFPAGITQLKQPLVRGIVQVMTGTAFTSGKRFMQTELASFR